MVVVIHLVTMGEKTVHSKKPIKALNMKIRMSNKLTNYERGTREKGMLELEDVKGRVGRIERLRNIKALNLLMV